ncbi:WD40 repeat-like protein [Cyathus striatus]|nr:WD40 repeat-like protein [Cyathus striatus]
MKLSDSDLNSNLSTSPDMAAGPSSPAFDATPVKNGHMNGNGFDGFVSSVANGTSSGAAENGLQKHGKAIAKVNLPGTTLYEDSFVDREEFVRLVIQSLRDVGYIESAATLEAESGYELETQDVSQFREYILNGLWGKAEAALIRLGVDEEGLRDTRFLISQQKYLELLEAKKTTSALHVLRNELAPMHALPQEPASSGEEADRFRMLEDRLHMLSSFIMCSEPEDLRKRADWDGASGRSRHQLLDNLQLYIPSSVMIPQQRLSILLQQARAFQEEHCVYHNSPSDNLSAFSLYSDHQCSQAYFPRRTAAVLVDHKDEVWNMEWSHGGLLLATASKDKTAIIWHAGASSTSGSASQEWDKQHILRDHPFPVGCLAWSLDDKILLTSCENYIKMWNVQTGVCIRMLEEHTETVTALSWLPDGSGFISGGLDRKIIHWDSNGKVKDAWPQADIRVTDLAVTPDFTRVVAIGMVANARTVVDSTVPRAATTQSGDGTWSGPGGNGHGSPPKPENKMMIFDWETRQQITFERLEGELTSLKVSRNSQYALINHAPDEIHLWDLSAGRLARKYTGQRQGKHVIRSCFGGIDENFVVSGSEDGNIYVWHRDSGVLLEVLQGHGEGSVNSVAWHPKNPCTFASCSDDHTVRIWEPEVPMTSVEHQDGAPVFNEKGKTRQRWDSNGVDPGT